MCLQMRCSRRQASYGRNSAEDASSSRAYMQTLRRPAPTSRPHLLRRMPPELPARAVRERVLRFGARGDREQEDSWR